MSRDPVSVPPNDVLNGFSDQVLEVQSSSDITAAFVQFVDVSF